jgi:hypothetical protein
MVLSNTISASQQVTADTTVITIVLDPERVLVSDGGKFRNLKAFLAKIESMGTGI